MKSYYYDLHLHSCLSPCADDDMTPATIAGMLKLAGIEIAALTDHNTTRNCPAFFEACRAYGVIPIAGMELTTAEEIHVVCLFPSLEAASLFEDQLKEKRINVKNRPDLFGHQWIMNADDEIIGEDEFLLSAATALSLEEAFDLVNEHAGVCYPAHIDRESGGIIAILGTLPETPAFCAVEFRDLKNVPEYRSKHTFPHLVLSSSDSHFLTGIPDASVRIALEGKTENEIAQSLIRTLKGKSGA